MSISQDSAQEYLTDNRPTQNTLYQTLSYEEVATKHETSPDKVREIIARSITKLKAYRDETRPRPHLDDKILVSWNGLMVSRSVCTTTNRDSG